MSGSKLAEIIAAAVRLFQHQGYHATSMQDIADAVGLQKGSLYHYISSKEDLLICIVQDAVDTYIGRIEEIAASPLPPQEKMAAAMRQHLQGIATNMGSLTVFLREAHALTPDQRAVVRAGTNRYNSIFEEMHREGVRAGVFRDLNSKLVCRTLLGSCNWVYRWYRPDGQLSQDELTDFVVNLLFNGINADRAADTPVRGTP